MHLTARSALKCCLDASKGHISVGLGYYLSVEYSGAVFVSMPCGSLADLFRVGDWFRCNWRQPIVQGRNGMVAELVLTSLRRFSEGLLVGRNKPLILVLRAWSRRRIMCCQKSWVASPRGAVVQMLHSLVAWFHFLVNEVIRCISPCGLVNL